MEPMIKACADGDDQQRSDCSLDRWRSPNKTPRFAVLPLPHTVVATTTATAILPFRKALSERAAKKHPGGMASLSTRA